jgi:PAS domain S-box-containing protein
MNARLIPALKRASLLACGAAAALAAVTLWGWVLDLAALRDLGAHFPPMPPAGALCALLLAGGFLAAERGRLRSACSAAVVAGLIAALALLGINVDLGFEARLMSPAAAISVLLLAAATPLEPERRLLGFSASGMVAGVVGLIAFFALLGMSLRMLRFDLAAPLLGFSAPGALAALLGALALAAGRPSAWTLDVLSSRRTGAVVTRWLLPAAFAVPLAVGWTRLVAEREGVFSEAFGMALFTLLMIALFSALILWVAHTLERAERQRAAAEGQASEQREWLQVTLAAIGEGVIAADAAGRVRFLNQAAQRLTGWRADEAAARPAAELLQLFDERSGAPIESPLNAALRMRVAAVAGGDPALRARDGSVHAIDINAAPIVDAGDGVAGAVLVLRDAAAHRRAERAMREAYTELDQRVVRRTAALERASAALQERNALLNAITTSTPDLIFAKDRQGRMLVGNPAWVRAAGRSGVDAQGLDDNERIVLEAGETMMLEEVIGGGAGSEEEEKIYLTTKSPLRDEQGRVIGLIGIATDITERKRAQRELEKLVVAEQRLRAEAERANRAKDEFLAIVSHELRSPLNALRGWSHLLATTRPLEAGMVERGARAIMRNVDSQTRLIDDLLDTSRIVSGRLNIERRAANLVDIVNAALEATRTGAAAKRIALRFTPDDPAIMVEGDAGRLQQLASNLLSNAVKFTPEGGAVQVALLRNGERVQLQVRDNGIGIAAEFLPHVFDRFTQADTSSTRRAGGLGIGLALVRHIALLHGGQVSASSGGIGKGAVFTVDLPAAPQQAAAILAVLPTVEQRQPRGALAGVHAWLVDDDADAHEVVALTLGQHGAAVETFGSSTELASALERALPAGGPDVLLVDIAMPGEDGFAALRRARSIEAARGTGCATPAIALTAFTQIERERLAAAGFADRVNKPLDADKLVAAIRAAIEHGRRAAERVA